MNCQQTVQNTFSIVYEQIPYLCFILSFFKYFISYKQTLTVLKIKCNRIGDEEIANIADMLNINKTITEIDLTNNHIGENGASSIANALLTNDVIIYLN